MNSINYPNYNINVDNINALGNTLYLGTSNMKIQVGQSSSMLDLYGNLKINGSSGQSGYVLSNNGTNIGWEKPNYSTSKGITGSLQYNDGNSGFTGNTLFTYTLQPSVGSTGTIDISNNTLRVVGTNTNFTTELRINQPLIVPNGGGTLSFGEIDKIIDDTNLDLKIAPNNVHYNGSFYTTPYNKFQLDGDLVPSLLDTYSLGNKKQYWRNLYIGPGTITLQNEKKEEGHIGLNNNGILYTDHGLASPFITIGPLESGKVGSVGGWRLYSEEDASLNSTKLLAQANAIDGTYGTTGPVYTLIPPVPSPSLTQVMAVGNTAGTTLDMNYNDIIRVHGISGSNIYLTTNSLYVNGSSGTAEQVLSVGETGPKWTSLTTPSLAQVMAVGNTAVTTLDMSYNDIIRVHGISGSNIYLTTNSLYVNGSSGTTGQVLSVGGTGPAWTSVSGLKGDTGPIGITGPTGPSGITGSTSINGGILDFGNSKIIYGTYTTINNDKDGTIYFNHSFTSSTSYSLTLTILDPSVTDNSVSITQKGITFAGYYMQKGAVGHQVNWIAIGH